MNTHTETNPFETERRNTDRSLIAERDKASATLDSANFKSQSQTDEIVKDERTIADSRMASSRATYDGERSSEKRTSKSDEAKVLLDKERESEDTATGVERLKIDEALLVERKSTSELVARILEQERTATDKNLLSERNLTDSARSDSNQLLKTEVADHLATRGQLTSRGEFLAIVSHDLRSPVGAIGSYADLILEDAKATGLDVTTLGYVHAIKRNAEISIRLIADLLDLERISAGKLEMVKAGCTVSALVEATRQMFDVIAIGKGMTLNFNATDDKAVIDCDKVRILQVISNLLGNAMKYSTQGGTITISVSKDKDSRVRFSIRDQGAGIPKEKQSAIFERFTQLRSKDRTGLGLGLYIAKMIVRAHGGAIGVSSQPGQGSEFYFSLPAS